MAALFKICLSFVFLLYAGLSGMAPAATISSGKSTVDETFAIEFSGEIVPGDAARLQQEIDRINSENKPVGYIFLNSPGGSLLEGLRIGRVIRKNRLGAYAMSEDNGGISCNYSSIEATPNGGNGNRCECASSCALAWMGGVRRYGVVGVHRGYLSSEDVSGLRGHEANLGEAYAQVETYLREMRANSRVMDVFMSTPSSALTRLTGDDVGEQDPIYEEYKLNMCHDHLVPEQVLRERNRIIHKQMLSEIASGPSITESERSYRDTHEESVQIHNGCLFQATILALYEAQLRDYLCARDIPDAEFRRKVDIICNR